MFAPVRLQDFPSKMRHRLLRSVTWTEVDAAFDLHIPLRIVVRLAARVGQRFGMRQPRSSGSAAAHKIRRRHFMAHSQNVLEHRWGERAWVNIPVHVSVRASAEVDGCMKNLSMSGALMKADCELGLHTLIAVRIELPPPLSRVAVLKAYVSRKLKDAVGIEWCEFAPTIVKDLLRSPSVRIPP
jgi:hypothetical protein